MSHSSPVTLVTGSGTTDTLVARLRIGLWLLIALGALLVLTDITGPREPLALLFGLHCTPAVAAVIAFVGLRRGAANERAILVAITVVAIAAATAAAAGIAAGDSGTARRVYLLLPLGCAMVLRWGLRPQLAVIAISVAVLLGSLYFDRAGLVSLFDHPVSLVALAASGYLAHAFSRLSQSEAQAVTALRESEAELRGVIANMQDVVFRNDINGTIRYLSPSVRQFGYTPEELVGTDAGALYVYPEEQQRVRSLLLENGSVADFEVSLKRKDGGVRIVSVSAHLISDDSGRPSGFEGVLRDISARKQAEEAVRASEARFRALVQNTSEAICVVDANSVIQYASPAMERITGFQPSQLVGGVTTQFVHPDDYRRLFEGFAALNPGMPYRAEHRMRHANGSWVDVETIGTILLHDPAINGVVLNVRDINDRKRLEQQRADFIAMLVHDIRNPLAIIAGYTDILLQSEGIVGEAREMLVACEQSVQTLMSLVANSLQQSQIEAGQLTLQRQTIGINELLYRVCRHYQAVCAMRRISFDLRVRPGLASIDADPVAIERAITNLLQNAVKFTPDGGRITVEADQPTGDLTVSVSDTGPGIAPAELPELFSRYRRATTGRTRQGTGLGLFIVKALVEAHGGRVEVVSTLGAGSRFTLVLPRATAAPAT
ncbi:MAG TPA: PAS domain-containing sensor histidine kinase [Candidatus Binatia bacterium]|nr:PAS domain-containing sensor histidine kinase [Candidatus Binatia bacterium]